jgi:hypothetical protein
LLSDDAQLKPQTLNIADSAIHRVVGQKSDIHGNSEITAKKNSCKNKLAFQRYFGARN